MRPDKSDVLMVCGAVLTSVGAWMVYAPAGVIVGGLFCVGFGWLVGLTASTGDEEG